MTTALYIGRFQPFHNGHLDAINQILKDDVQKLIIGIGSSQEELTQKNPFSYYERKEMLEKVLKNNFPTLKYEVYPIPDFNSSKAWTKFILKEIPEFQILYSGNPYTELCFKKEKQIEFRKLDIHTLIKAVNIRQNLYFNKDWQKFLPKEITKYLEKINGTSRIKKIFDLDSETQKNIKFGTEKIQKVLVVEKITRYNYLEERNRLVNLEEEYLKELTISKEIHEETKELLLNQLKAFEISFDLTNDEKIKNIDYEKYEAVISLGGDGTFLHAVKNVTSGYAIGINSEPNVSEGVITKFQVGDIPILIENLVKGEFRYQEWDRLSATVNGIKLPYLALNEIIVGKSKIYSTSKLQIEIGDKSAYSIGNGILVATKTGNTAFYKSAGGVPFEEPNFGYVLVLPHKIDGDLDKTKVLTSQTKVKISPKRLNHTLIFDCDEEREIVLNQEDEIEILKEESNSLKVIL